MLPRALLCLGIVVALGSRAQAAEATAVSVDVVVVGAGISGLSAALEAGQGPATVMVIDMASVFGGHAVMSEGGVSIVDSPVQRAAGISDSPQLAFGDFKAWGEDINEAWAHYYVEHSRADVHDWLIGLGVTFDGLRMPAGNHVPRFHDTHGRGLGLVGPIYRACLARANISFAWNSQATALLTERGRVVGVETKNLRSGQVMRVTAAAVILATGGFQNNLELLREHWPKTVNFPERLLLGSGANSLGLGHKLAESAGADLTHLDYFWHYPFGLPDPRDPQSLRGLNARNPGAIWVNAKGQRFVNELWSPKFSLQELLRQPGGTYWAIFDEETKPLFQIAGTDWIQFSAIERLIFGNPKLVKKADSLDALAAAAGVPPAALKTTVARYNESVTRSDDVDFGRFGPSSERYAGQVLPATAPPRRIEKPPFYAVQFFPMSRKNNGGIKIDLSCRVISRQGAPIPGLFAVGEATGSAGMNGKAGLEGVWLGPGILTGRVAGKAAAADLPKKEKAAPMPALRPPPPTVTESKQCLECHAIDKLVADSRPGFWHFEQVHRTVRQRDQLCLECHADLVPNPATRHRINPLVLSVACASCHGK